MGEIKASQDLAAYGARDLYERNQGIKEKPVEYLTKYPLFTGLAEVHVEYSNTL